MKILKEDNPERYGYVVGKYIILCQIENDTTSLQEYRNHSLSIIKAINGNRPAYKVKTLYEGNPEDFCMEYDGQIEYGGLDVELAFEHFLTKNLRI